MNRRNFIRGMTAAPMAAMAGTTLAHVRCINPAPDDLEAHLMLHTDLDQQQALRTAHVIYSLSH